MKLDPSTAALYTDSGKFLKILRCPLQKNWDSLKVSAPGIRHCDSCARTVHDTSRLTDQDLEQMIHEDPDICLKVSARQRNCTFGRGDDLEKMKIVNELPPLNEQK